MGLLILFQLLIGMKRKDGHTLSAYFTLVPFLDVFQCELLEGIKWSVTLHKLIPNEVIILSFVPLFWILNLNSIESTNPHELIAFFL